MEKAIEIKRSAQRAILKGDLNGALAEYEKLVALGDPDPYYCVLLADLLYKMGKAVDAERRYLEAIDGYSKSGLYKNGIAVCKKLSRLSLAPVEVPRWLAKLYSLDGLGTEASLAYQQLADVLVRSERIDEARDAIRQAIEVSPDAARLYERLGDLEVLAGNNEAAGDAWSEAAERFERSGQEADVRRCRTRIAQLQLATPPRTSASGGEAPAGEALDGPKTLNWEGAPSSGSDPMELSISHGPPSPDGATTHDDSADAESRSGEVPAEAVSVEPGFAGLEASVAAGEDEYLGEEDDAEADAEAAADVEAGVETEVEVEVEAEAEAEAEADAGTGTETEAEIVMREVLALDPPLGSTNIAVPELSLAGFAPEDAGLDPVDVAGDDFPPQGYVTTLTGMLPPPPAVAVPFVLAAPAATGLSIERFNDSAAPAPASSTEPPIEPIEEDSGLAQVSLILAEAQACFHAGDRDSATMALIRAAQAYDYIGRYDSAVAIYRSLGQSADVSLQLMMLWLKNCQRRDDREEASQVACDLGERALNDNDLPGAREWFERARGYDSANDLPNRRLRAMEGAAAGVANPAGVPPSEVTTAASNSGRLNLRTHRDEPVLVDLGTLIEEFQRGIEPELASDPQGHYDLGMSYREMGLTEQAVTSLRVAAKSPRFRLRAGELGGRCLLDLGRFDEAADMLRDTLNAPDLLASAAVDLRYQLALSLEAAGRSGESLIEFERVYAAQANYPDVAMKIRLLRKSAEAA